MIKSCIRLGVVAVLLLTKVSVVHADDSVRPAMLPVQAYARLPEISDVIISPDGEYLAFLVPKEGRNHLVIQSLGEGVAPVMVPPVDKLHFRWLRWAV